MRPRLPPDPPLVSPEGETVQKALARAGIGSRRQVERWLQEGRIAVNGWPVRPGARLDRRDRVTLDGRPLPRTVGTEPPVRVLRYHKPEGELCTRRDEARRPTVFDGLPRADGRWIAVGRLDLNASGLLLFTNHGELARRLMHPVYGVEREYAVRVYGEATRARLARLRRGVDLQDGAARFLRIAAVPGRDGGQGRNRWFYVTLAEGRNREVRRLWESQGLRVSRLQRVRFGPCRLPLRSRPGSLRELRPGEVHLLMQAVRLRSPVETSRDYGHWGAAASR